MVNSVAKFALLAIVLAAPCVAADRGELRLSDKSYHHPEDKRWKAENGLQCRIVDARAGILEITIRDRKSEALILYHWGKGFRIPVGDIFLIRQFERDEAPAIVTVHMFDDRSQPSDQYGYERSAAPLIASAGRYEIVSLESLQEEFGEGDWALGSCKLVVERAEKD